MGKHDSDSDSDDSRSGDEDAYRKHKKDKKERKKEKKDKKDKDKKDKHRKHRDSDDERLVHQQFKAAAPDPMHSPDTLLVQAPGGSISPRPPSRLSRPPPSGYRVPLTAEAPFPSPQQAGPPPTYDLDGTSPIYFGSALFPNGVHPCKVAPHHPVPCFVPYGGREWKHSGRYDLLPWNAETMELVPASGGVIPHGRRPVEGGYAEGGQKLYHAVGVVQGVRTPGKTAQFLGGANIPFGGAENVVTEYEILCWRD